MSILNLINEHIETIELLKGNSINKINTLAGKCISAINNNKKIIFMGNGGSAADCQHLAAEFVGRFEIERKALPAISLTTDTSIITAIGNDYGYEYVFERQIMALCNEGDITIGVSTSGNSENVNRAIKEAKKRRSFTVGLTGKDGGVLRNLCDLSIVVPSCSTARIQESHILIGHILCDVVDRYFHEVSIDTQQIVGIVRK